MKDLKLRKRSLTLRSLRSSKTVVAILIIVIAVISVAALSMSNNSSNRAQAQGKRYKATRPIVLDRQTGKARLPNEQEIEQVVANLSSLAKRPEDLPQTVAPGGAVVVDLENGYGGVFLARPNDAGGWETKCVFTFDEGAEFLGLVQDSTE